MNTLFINQTAAKSIAPIFTGVFKAISLIPNPLRILRAYEEMSKFRKLDSSSLKDMGLNQTDVDATTITEFFSKR